MSGVYHEGELAVQERAGVRDMASRIGRGIRDEVPAAAAEFLAERRFAVLGWADGDGRVWASVVAGEPGFLSATGPHAVRVGARPVAGDPLAAAWPLEGEVGLVAIDFATRRRMRVNGAASADGEGGIEIRPRQVYSNCPKYIQAREELPAPSAAPGAAAEGTSLTAAQRDRIARADTFFIASHHPEAGADASHRGGLPGFVRVPDATTVAWPDYAGNTMFQTLGNIESTGRAGLVFLDFETGATLQIAGTARIAGGDDRRVELTVERVVEVPSAIPLRWRFVGYSPFNPEPYQNRAR